MPDTHTPPDRAAPTVAVLGNCQTEVYRDRLRAHPHLHVPTLPLVHEATPADLDHIHRTLASADIAIMQPVVDNYRRLPLGYRQLAAHLPGCATLIVVPVLRYAGLHPYTVVIRPPSDRSLVPPLVPYHDLRTLAAVALDDPCLETRTPSAQQVRAGHDESVHQLRIREHTHQSLAVSDLLEDYPRWHTINHPDRSTLNAVLQRIIAQFPADIAVPTAVVSDREPLGAIRAPILSEVEDALGLERQGPRVWRTPAGYLDPAEVAQAHRGWYRDHPDAVTEGMRRHADRLELLGLL